MGKQPPEEGPDDAHEEIEEPAIVGSAHRHGVAEADMLHALRFAIAHVRKTTTWSCSSAPTGPGP